MMRHPKPVTLFLSYAREDEALCQELIKHLSGLKRQGLISAWHNNQIPVGTGWAQAINTHLEQASIVLLLVSPDFLASDYCYNIEMLQALQRHEFNEARVIPVVVRPCDWEHTPLAQLQNLPRDGKPIVIWDNQDVAWNDVSASLRRIIEDMSLLSINTSSHAALPNLWNIPYPRNPFFTGRDDLLLHLRSQLQVGQAMALSASSY